jgi:GNAT superfamily N-acetyltransferase
LEEIPAIAELARESFMADVAPHYTEEGIRTFLNFSAPEAMAKRVCENCVVHVAYEQDRPVGMLMVRDGTDISMLFVASDRQRKGIARKLVEVALSQATTRDCDRERQSEFRSGV